MNNKKPLVINLWKIYKRKINTDLLAETMQRMQSNKILKEASKSIANEDYMEKIKKLKEKVEIKVNNEKYETIQENLNESLNIMKELNANFKKIKEESINIEVKIEQEDKKIEQIEIDKLNINNRYVQDNKIINENLKNKYENYDKIDEKIIENGNSIKKSILDVEWLQPFLDFMNNHSTLVLTIGSGLVMGGIWYMNNVGIINIGSLLTRLGISIFSGSTSSAGGVSVESNSHRVNQTVPQNTIEASNTNREVATGFFRELGQKVLKLLDVLITKMESKTQKYK